MSEKPRRKLERRLDNLGSAFQNQTVNNCNLLELFQIITLEPDPHHRLTRLKTKAHNSRPESTSTRVTTQCDHRLDSDTKVFTLLSILSILQLKNRRRSNHQKLPQTKPTLIHLISISVKRRSNVTGKSTATVGNRKPSSILRPPLSQTPSYFASHPFPFTSQTSPPSIYSSPSPPSP